MWFLIRTKGDGEKLERMFETKASIGNTNSIVTHLWCRWGKNKPQKIELKFSTFRKEQRWAITTSVPVYVCMHGKTKTKKRGEDEKVKSTQLILLLIPRWSVSRPTAQLNADKEKPLFLDSQLVPNEVLPTCSGKMEKKRANFKSITTFMTHKKDWTCLSYFHKAENNSMSLKREWQNWRNNRINQNRFWFFYILLGLFLVCRSNTRVLSAAIFTSILSFVYFHYFFFVCICVFVWGVFLLSFQPPRKTFSLSSLLSPIWKIRRGAIFCVSVPGPFLFKISHQTNFWICIF